MLSLQIPNIKEFMTQLLIRQTFDDFLLVEGSVTTYNTFIVDGHLHPDFYSKEEQELMGLADRRFSSWAEIRPFMLSLIKGKRTPLSFQFTFQLSEARTRELLTASGSGLTPTDVSGLVLNIRYDGGSLTCTTAVSLRLFSLDKSLEQTWDQALQRFLMQQNITFQLPANI